MNRYYPDPYVKINLLFNNQRISKKKTHVKKRTLDPVFNESFVFDLPDLGEKGLGNMSLELVVLDWDRVTKNEVNVLLRQETDISV
jgi:Ca2+-dependent lipid-binding protein